jgi:endonuclease/exonuclease/phosphatase family metal-dependent hydrolase
MPTSLRVMTYNLRVPGVDPDEPSWAARRDKVASMIRFHAPDVLGVQEAVPRMLDDLDARLDDYTWTGQARDADSGEHCALLHRPDRLPMETHDTFWLSTTPEVPGSRSWDAAFPRIVTGATFRDPRTDRPLTVFNTHFDHDGATARRESARILREQMDARAGDAPVVVMGDLNTTPDTPPYRRLVTGGPGPPLRDALRDSTTPHHGPTATFNGFGDRVQPDTRIDYCFVRGPLTVERHGTLTDRWNGSFPSDHCPVWAAIRRA